MPNETNPDLSLLLLDAGAGARDRLPALLAGAVRSFRVETPAAFEPDPERLSAGRFDAVLLELGVPAASGLEVLRRLSSTAPALPVIALSQSEDEATALLAVSCGAHDCLVTSRLERATLVRAIRHAIARKRLELRLLAVQEQRDRGRAMDVVARLAGGVAHEVNNSLMTVLGLTELALDSEEPGAPSRNGLLGIRKAGNRAAELIRQLLAFGRRQALQARPLDLNAFLGRLSESLRPEPGEKLDVALDLAPDLGLAMADPAHVEQALGVLIASAREVMPAGGWLTLSTCNRVLVAGEDAAEFDLAPGPYVGVSVANPGPALTSRELERFFEPFAGDREGGKLSGLALAGVFGLFKQSGGGIRVRHEAGLGRIVEVLLPRQSPAATELEAAGPRTPAFRRRQTILVVEDEVTLRGLVGRVLRAAGFGVLEAADGMEALELCARPSTEFDLLLTDIVMPRMDGCELVERLGVLRPGFKVLYMSGYGEQTALARAQLSAQFLAKPFSAEALMHTVRGLLDARP